VLRCRCQLNVPYLTIKQCKDRRKILVLYSWMQARVELVELPEALDRAEAYGRIAFSIQDSEVKN